MIIKYYVRAVDKRYNLSEPSNIAALNRPDKIAHASPLLSHVLPDPKDEFSVASFILIFHNNLGPTNAVPRTGPNKHKFIRNPLKQEIGLEWDNLWDGDGNPILTDINFKGVLPYAPTEWPKVIADLFTTGLTLNPVATQKLLLKK